MVLQESFTGTKIVKAFGREGLEQERFDDVNDRLLAPRAARITASTRSPSR